jgi:hypothetical protein
MKMRFGIILGLGLTFAACGDSIWDGDSSENYNTVANWEDNTLPNAADNTYMDGAGTGVTTLGGSLDRAVNSLHVRNGHTFNIDTTANLTSDFAIRIGEVISASLSTINLVSGELSAGSEFSMSSSVGAGTSVFNISGGSLTVASLLVGSSAVATFAVDGDAGSVSALGDVAAYANAIFSFALGGTGISSIDSTGALLISDGASLVIDGSGYTGGEADFTLFSFASHSGSFASGDITVTGLGVEGTDWTLTQGADSIALNVIPEPATLGLITCFGLGMLIVRRAFMI